VTTLFDLTLALAGKLGVVRSSTATGTTSTSVTPDTKRTEGLDAFNGGTIWITSADGAAPEDEYARVTDFVTTGGVITHSALTVATASGDSYSIATARYPLDTLINAINVELRKFRIPLYDRTSLDIVADQSEYTLPAGIRGENLINVYEETDTDANDSQPVALNWSVQEAATGTQHTLVIHSRNVTTGNDIMLEYLSWCPAVYDYDDVIDDIVPVERILAGAAATCELTRMRTYSSGSKLDIEMLNYYQREAIMAEQRFPIRYPARRGSVLEA